MILRIAFFLLLATVSAFAQGSIREQAFTKALDEELAKRSDGKWLYERSEGYRKSVLQNISERLHLGTANKLGLPEDQTQSLPGTFSGNVSNDLFGQEETTVAISRNDPNRIIIASNDEISDKRSLPVYLSADAGRTWSTFRMPIPPKPYYAWCDPYLAADQFNGFYYAYILENPNASFSNIMVAHSPDGINWTYGSPVVAGKGASTGQEDKESIAVDFGTTSSTNGRVYVSWSHSDTAASMNGLQLAWSDDNAANWSTPVRIDSGSGFFSQVKVDNVGNVFYTYSGYRDDGGVAEHYLLTSYDHGATFVRRKIADFHNYPYSVKQYVPTLKGTKGIRSFPYIAMDYDSRINTLHVVYGSYEKWNDTTHSAMLYYVKTTDAGITWSHPYPVGFQVDSSSLQTDRFMPWISIDEEKGDVHILYYSSQDDPKNLKCAAYLTIIHAEGPVTHTKLSDSAFDPLRITDYSLNPVLGDYIGSAIRGTTFAYTWTEGPREYADGEVYAYIKSQTSGVSEIRQVSANALRIFSIYPNPSFNNKITLGFAIPQNGNVSISLTSIDGTLCRKLFYGGLTAGTHEKTFDINGLANGSYFISLENGDVSVQKEIIVTH